MSSYYVFIVTSRDNPIYEKFDSIRRKQMCEQNVPYKFLLNGSLPEGYILQDDEEYPSYEGMSPGMFLKFIKGCEKLEQKYDFILRLNSSTFVDFNKIPQLLKILPRTNKIVAGHPVEYHPPFK